MSNLVFRLLGPDPIKYKGATYFLYRIPDSTNRGGFVQSRKVHLMGELFLMALSGELFYNFVGGMK